VKEACTLRLTVKKKKKFGNVRDIAKMTAPKTASIVYNALRVGPRLILRSAFELLRANIITRILSAVVLLSIDTVSFIRKRISLKQYIIDIALAVMLVVGGTLGWSLGSRLGDVLLENALLMLLAGIIGAGVLGAVLGAVAEKIIKLFVQDDNADMLVICNKVYDGLADEYTLNEDEREEVSERVYICDKMLKDMFCQKDRESFARAYIKPFCEEAANKRHD
jgi:Na+-driven multidrug efflux pump